MGRLLERDELVLEVRSDMIGNKAILHPENKFLRLLVDDVEGVYYRPKGWNAWNEVLYHRRKL